MKFKEALPASCPPNHALGGACESAFRLIETAKPLATDFASSAAKKLPKPLKVDDCRWASCSLFATIELLRTKQKVFPKLRKCNFYVEIKIPANAGRHVTENGHIDFWMFTSFDPLAVITKIAAV